MELSKQTQTLIALISGVALGALLVFMFMQNYYESKIARQSTTPAAQTQQVADEQPAPTEASESAPAATTHIPEETPAAPAEPVTPAEPAADTAPAAISEAPSSPEAAAPAPQPADATTVAKTDSPAYTYTAQPGDSYSVLARKAVQTYGLAHKITLSHEQIIAAEAFLTTQAGSPELNEGQQVTIAIDSVKSAVDSAQKLSAGELALWDVYVQDVDFNTNANG